MFECLCSPTDKLHDGAHQRGEDELGEEDHGADDGHVRADAAHLAADHGRDVPRRLLLLGPRLRVPSLPAQITSVSADTYTLSMSASYLMEASSLRIWRRNQVSSQWMVSVSW